MELEFIKDMFDGIARRYDLLNRILSLGQDVYWRRWMVSSLSLNENALILDVACGTGDVIVEILRQQSRIKRVIGVDFSFRMLQCTQAKLKALNNPSNVALVLANGLHLPFPPDLFDAVTIAFGIRNITDRKKALTIFLDRLKPGGTLAVLELATPERRLFQSIYLLYFKKMVPKIGAFFSKHLNAYTYLPASVIHFPKACQFAALMRESGFTGVTWRPLTSGIAVLFIGYKP